MRNVLTLAAFAAVLALGLGAVAAGTPQTARPLFDTSSFRPEIVLHELPLSTDGAFVTVTGVVFSRAPIERVTVGDRTANTREAEPKDLVRFRRVPPGASDAPFRTFFEVPDAGLPRLGANDLEIVAVGSDGRTSDAHRVTIVRSLAPPATPKSS